MRASLEPTRTALLGLVATLLGAPACTGAPITSATDASSSTGSGSTDTTGVDTTTTTTTTTTADTTTTTSVETTDTSTSGSGVCGDGVVDEGEACDDGNAINSDGCLDTCVAASCGDGVVHKGVEECDDGNAEDDDECLNACTKAVCGDGVIHKIVEVCDNGPENAFGVYGGCTPFCTPGPFCGDSKLDPQESCDDGNDGDANDGCLDGCVRASSCKTIKDGKPDSESGLYKIVPEGLDFALNVWCDMETDRGGYTFVKVDIAKEMNSPPLSAALAEAECAKVGLQLFVPRTVGHLKSAYEVATKTNVVPIGGGTVTADVSYLNILGIYPTTPQQSCVSKPLNSLECPEWRATDNGPFWVTATPINGQPSTSNCLGCSMYYEWNGDGSVKSYLALGMGGFASVRFLCDVGDKSG